MEAIKGRGLAGAQLTASGAGEEGDMDQNPNHCREEQVNCREEEVWQFVQLPVCLSVRADLDSLSFLGCNVLAFTLKGQLVLY